MKHVSRLLPPCFLSEVILNSGKDEAVLKSFMGFISFRSGATVCLPLQALKTCLQQLQPKVSPQATIPKDESGQEVHQVQHAWHLEKKN